MGQTREQGTFSARMTWKGIVDVVFELGLSRIVGLIHARVEVTRDEECKVSWEHE